MSKAHPKEAEILDREWFYPFRLPSGRVTRTYDDGRLDPVHATRLEMIDRALAPLGPDLSGLTAIDLACHQGYFALELAGRGLDRVLGIDVRPEHVADASLMAEIRGQNNFKASVGDVDALSADELGRFDVVLMLGLIYHLENPVGAIRLAHALTRRVCVLETQVVPNLSGNVDWGNYRFVKELKGCFGIVDETDETHGPEIGTRGIGLAPSTEGLVWIMRAVGFDQVELIPPPKDAYEQHRYGKRVVVAGYREPA